MSLEVDGLHFGYGDRQILRDASLRVAAGESGFLLGPSGCGKSTLLRCIAGLETPAGGAVQLAGHDLADVPVHRRRIGLLHQEPALFPHLDVTDNVAFGLRMQGMARQVRRQAAQTWLEQVRLGDRADAAVDELSGGERQRVCLARALAARPKAVLLDEPLSALDVPLRQALGQEIKALLAQQGVAALWVTHDPGEADALADVAWRMEGGRCMPSKASLNSP